MPRAARVLSFMSQWGPPQSNNSSQPGPPSPTYVVDEKARAANVAENVLQSPTAATPSAQIPASPTADSPVGNRFRERSASQQSGSRPASMIQTMAPPLMEVSGDTLPELQRIFTFLNARSTKLYQEGYFLKLHDLDTRGRPSTDRVWTECFAQLVGTQLSLWDAQSLDAAGEHGEVVPTFINLADASIKMIENLPMNSPGASSLQNVLSISTAANNRYLLHFNSLNSLTQWTAGIRLAMFEHASLQEAYTGSLIAGKGRHLNNIRAIMNRTTFKIEDWARVRFGAGTPWRRCWYVIEPPDEKEYKKAQSAVKKNPYEKPPRVNGCIRFYDSNKIKKKSIPIATITDAYSAYAVYPVTRQLIDQSTLLKIDGRITIHGTKEVETEGFVFVMPEVHPMVSGFEMLLRFLFPTWDVFNLYGRPTKLIADPIDSKGLMFALPTDRRYGYLEILDVATLIHTKGSGQWSEYRWRKEMKAITSSRMDITPEDRPATRSSSFGSRRKKLSRSSLPGSRAGVRFGDETPPSEPTSNRGSPGPRSSFDRPVRAETSPNGFGGHRRSLSERLNSLRGHSRDNSRMEAASMSAESLQRGPPPPPHRELFGNAVVQSPVDYVSPGSAPGSGGHSPDSFEGAGNPIPEVEALSVKTPPPAPVAAPPAFAHGSSQPPPFRPQQAAQSRSQPIDDATLNQLADINRNGDVQYASYATAGASAAWGSQNNSHYRNSSAEGLDNYNMLSAPQDQQRALSASPRYRPQRSHLPTIPASPFVDQMQPSPKASYFEPAGPPVPEHSESSTPSVLTPGGQSTAAAAVARPDLPRAGSSMSIRRKPVGGAGAATGSHLSADNASVRSLESLGSLKGAVIDQKLLEQIGNDPHDGYGHALEKTRSVSPDWASVKSSHSQGSVNRVPVERPRAGVKRTVGTLPSLQAVAAPQEVVIGDTHFGVSAGEADKPTVSGAKANESAFLDIDFGPTYAMRTGTPTDTSVPKSASKEPTAKSSSAALQHPGAKTPDIGGDYLAAETAGKKKVDTPVSSGPLAWRPGMVNTAARHQSKPSLSAEEWVQQRASMTAQPSAPPPFPHARNKSSLELLKHSRSASGTPPLAPPRSSTPSPVTTPGASRNVSADWTHRPALQHRRGTSRELLQGPSSRPVSWQMNSFTSNMTPGVDVNRPTGKELEYLARSAGAPLMSMSGNARKAPQEQPVGLVGAIAQREIEKRHVRDMSRSTAVQQALVSQNIQRQQAEAAHQRYSTVIDPQMYPPQWQPQDNQQQMSMQQPNMSGSMYAMPEQMMASSPALLQRQSSYPASMYGMGPTAAAAASVQSFGSPYMTQQQSMHDLQQAAKAKIQQEETERQQRMFSGRQSMMSMHNTHNNSNNPSAYGYGQGQGHQRGPTWG